MCLNNWLQTLQNRPWLIHFFTGKIYSLESLQNFQQQITRRVKTSSTTRRVDTNSTTWRVHTSSTTRRVDTSSTTQRVHTSSTTWRVITSTSSYIWNNKKLSILDKYKIKKSPTKLYKKKIKIKQTIPEGLPHLPPFLPLPPFPPLPLLQAPQASENHINWLQNHEYKDDSNNDFIHMQAIYINSIFSIRICSQVCNHSYRTDCNPNYKLNCK